MACNILDQAIANISITDTQSPNYKQDSTHKEHEHIFLYNINGEAYAYKLLSDGTYTEGKLVNTYTFEITGIHFWKYEGNQPLVSINDPIPDATGKTFMYKGKEYKYNLKPYNKIGYGDIMQTAFDLTANGIGDDDDIRHYDYNLNGVIDIEDIEDALLHCMSDPYFVLWELNEEAVMSYFNAIPKLGHTNAVIYRSNITQPIEYAFCIPTGYLNDEFEGVVSKYPVQILPLEEYDEISSKYEWDDFASDDELEYIVWEPDWKLWANGSYSNPINWEFRSGLHVFLLNNDGSPRMEWIE